MASRCQKRVPASQDALFSSLRCARHAGQATACTTTHFHNGGSTAAETGRTEFFCRPVCHDCSGSFCQKCRDGYDPGKPRVTICVSAAPNSEQTSMTKRSLRPRVLGRRNLWNCWREDDINSAPWEKRSPGGRVNVVF